MLGLSELIVDKNGRIYHLGLRPDDIADTIIMVGDPGRVGIVSGFFDRIETKVSNREFITHTGYYRGKKLTVISTGIGTDNIDIVVNELDALVNIDMKKREIKEKHKCLTFVRIGTSGGLQDDIPVDSFLLSKKAIGFDNVIRFYFDSNKISDPEFEQTLIKHIGWGAKLSVPYIVDADEDLFNRLRSEKTREGLTVSSPGFYGPQGRKLRLGLQNPEINTKITEFEYKGEKITNYEMESSAIYGLAKMLGHKAVTICAIIANRATMTFSKDYQLTVKELVEYTLDRIVE
ncbi:MAG: nucleoside phosphorylase [Bacteroidetes bacterium]|nr:nucleoside phosphorylase [Bacteroidota bacterium]